MLRRGTGLARPLGQAGTGSRRCASTAAAAVYTLGRGDMGQLGTGQTVSSHKAFRVEDIRTEGTIVQVAAGAFHTAALSDAGELCTFGSNFSQQLGHDEHSAVFTVFEEDQLLPGTVGGALEGHVEHVACGWYHTVAATRCGSLYSWGSAAWGQLGTGALANHAIPVAVDMPIVSAEQPDGSARAATPRCAALACGGGHSLALTEGGELLGWGNNRHGQLGTARCTHSLVPTAAANLEGAGRVKALAAGAFHSVALLEGGRVLQCGAPTAVPRDDTSPEPLHPHTMDSLLLTDESMGASFREMFAGLWGSSGTEASPEEAVPEVPEGPQAEAPVMVELGGGRARAVAAGEAHAAAIVGDGELWTWGLNAHGQRGEADSDASDVATPQPGAAAVLGGGAVTAVACGARFTAAYSAESHRLAVCGSGAAEFLSSPPPREDMASWREVSLVGVAEELAVSQMDAGDAHLVLLAAPR